MTILNKFFLLVWGLTGLLLAACTPSLEPTPTPAPTPTRPITAPRNDNVEALNAAQAALREVEFGFAPLLRLDEAKISVQSRPVGEIARLGYPQQPSDPTQWSTVDSFVSAYGTRYVLITLPHVNRVALGVFGVPASIDASAENLEHVATWVTFADRSRAVVDLTPLSTNFAPRHTPDTMIVDDNEIEAIFEDRRRGVDFDIWRPMTVVNANGQLYYLLAHVTASFDNYEFALRVHPVKPADPMEPMQIRPGILARLMVKRAEFSEFQDSARQAGQTFFADNPDLVTLEGSIGQPVETILDDQLDLLWHLVTKLEHQEPNPDLATPTPTMTPTSTPTPTPTPTPTRASIPLETS